MVWIIGLIAVIGFAWLMYINERFRRFGFGVLAVIAAGIALIWFYLDRADREREAERERELTAIGPSQIVLTDLTLSHESYGWVVEGRVANGSPHPLRAFTMRIFLQDCANSPEDAHCTTVGEDDALFVVNVPSRQARRLSTTVQFLDAPPLGPHWRWTSEITEIEADLRDNQP